MKIEKKTNVEERILHENDRIKKFIIVSGPVASGKTTLALNLAKLFNNCYYFDKDDLVDLSNVTFDVGGVVRDRHGDFFSEHIRNPEYVVTNKVGVKALLFNDTVIINAPYSGEITSSSPEAVENLKLLADEIHKKNANLVVIYMEVSPEVMAGRLARRFALDPEAAGRDAEIKGHELEYAEKKAKKAPDLDETSAIDIFYTYNADNCPASFPDLCAFLGKEPITFNEKINYEI